MRAAADEIQADCHHDGGADIVRSIIALHAPFVPQAVVGHFYAILVRPDGTTVEVSGQTQYDTLLALNAAAFPNRGSH